MSVSKSPLTKRLKEARVSAGISQKELGIAAGIDEFSASSRMNQYETGKHTPDYLTLKNISNVINYPVAYFYAEDNMLAEIILLFHRLAESKKEQILSYLKNI